MNLNSNDNFPFSSRLSKKKTSPLCMSYFLNNGPSPGKRFSLFEFAKYTKRNCSILASNLPFVMSYAEKFISSTDPFSTAS